MPDYRIHETVVQTNVHGLSLRVNQHDNPRLAYLLEQCIGLGTRVMLCVADLDRRLEMRDECWDGVRSSVRAVAGQLRTR